MTSSGRSDEPREACRRSRTTSSRPSSSPRTSTLMTSPRSLCGSTQLASISNSADFILTLMSVHVKEAGTARGLRPCGEGPVDRRSVPVQPLPRPSPDELLRVAVGLGLKRGVLQNAYQALRGRDPQTKVVSEELRDEQSLRTPRRPGARPQSHQLGTTTWWRSSGPATARAT